MTINHVFFLGLFRLLQFVYFFLVIYCHGSDANLISTINNYKNMHSFTTALLNAASCFIAC